MGDVLREDVLKAAATFAAHVDAHRDTFATSRQALLRYAAFRATRQPYCLRNQFSMLRQAMSPIPLFHEITRHWSSRSTNLLIAKAAEAVWERAETEERARWQERIW